LGTGEVSENVTLATSEPEMSIGLDLDPDYEEFCWIWIGTGLWSSS